MYKNFAKIYDKYTENLNYDDWVEFLERIIQKYGLENGSILDLGCGTGEVLLRLVDKYQVSGLDISEEMLKKAHKKLKKTAPLFLGDMREFGTGERYNLIFSFFDTVNHVTSMEDLIDTLTSVNLALEKGGIYVFDVVDREFMDEMFRGGYFADTRKDFALIWDHEYDEESGLDIISSTYFIKNSSKTYDRYFEIYEKKIFTRKEMEKACEITNLKIAEIIENETLAGKRYFYVLEK